MIFDERELLKAGELWLREPPGRWRRLDGAIWWLGPILVLLLAGVAIAALPSASSLRGCGEPAPRIEETPDPVVATKARVSRN